jgi:hypothetical protein
MGQFVFYALKVERDMNAVVPIGNECYRIFISKREWERYQVAVYDGWELTHSHVRVICGESKYSFGMVKFVGFYPAEASPEVRLNEIMLVMRTAFRYDPVDLSLELRMW